MGASFGSGMAYSIVSGAPNPIQSAITTGAAFALFNGLFYQVCDSCSVRDRWCMLHVSCCSIMPLMLACRELLQGGARHIHSLSRVLCWTSLGLGASCVYVRIRMHACLCPCVMYVRVREHAHACVLKHVQACFCKCACFSCANRLSYTRWVQMNRHVCMIIIVVFHPYHFADYCCLLACLSYVAILQMICSTIEATTDQYAKAHRQNDPVSV